MYDGHMSSADLRILHTADSHIGAGWPRRPRHRRPRRGDDICRMFHHVMQQAIVGQVDLVVHAGDVFDMPHPSPQALAAAAEPMLEVAAEGIPIVIVPGNHERSTIPTNVLLAHPNIFILDRPGTLRFDIRDTAVMLAGIPSLRRGAGLKFDEALGATKWQHQTGDVNLLVMHEAFDSAVCGPANYRFRRGDDVVSREAVPAAFDAVLCGHIHRHQILPVGAEDGPPIVYAGSPERISFAEIDEPKGCVVFESSQGRLQHQFIEHDVRPMLVMPLDITGMTGNAVRDAVDALLLSWPARAVGQIRLSGRSVNGQLRGLDSAARAWRLRPDVLCDVTTRGVEYESQLKSVATHVRRAESGDESVFDVLSAPRAETWLGCLADMADMPNQRGVYALSDGIGKLLYIGKAANLRSRVRSHLRGNRQGHYFRGWAEAVERIEVRLCDTDVEALLIEAELIRKYRPPFNRQMKRWRHYCYLCQAGSAWNTLEVCHQPAAGSVCFGPFRTRMSARFLSEAAASLFGTAACALGQTRRQGRRESGGGNGGNGTAGQLSLLDHGVALARSEPLAAPRISAKSARDASSANLCQRFFDGTCGGPCGDEIARVDYEQRIEQRDQFLLGCSDAPLRGLELQHAALLAQNESLDTDGERSQRRYLQTLRSGFAYVSRLRQAEQLLGQAVSLSAGADGEGGSAEPHGRFARLTWRGLAMSEQAPRSSAPRAQRKRLPKHILDVALILADHLNRQRASGD